MSEDSVIFLAEVSSSQVDTKSAVQGAVSPSPLNVPEENVAGERGEESPVGGLERPVEVVCETEVGTEADVEDEDEDVDVVGGVDEVGLSGFESEGFTLSEILRRNRLGKNVSERVIDTAHLPQCEFSNLHRLPLAFFPGFQETCGDLPGSFILDIGFFHGALTVIPVLHCLGFLLVVGGLVWAAECYVSVQFPVIIN